MKVESDVLIKEFKETIKEEFPEVSTETLKEIVFGPWRFLRDEMESGDLPEVRFKYFGKFVVYKGRAKFMLYKNKERLKKGLITQDQFSRYQEMIKNYLDGIK